MSVETGMRSDSPRKRVFVSRCDRFSVPPKTCTTAVVAVTSSTCPRRVSPSGDVISTSSSNATSEMFSMKTSGPSMDDTPLYSKPFISD